MKLDFQTDLQNGTSLEPTVGGETDSAGNSTDASSLLRAGIKAAREGSRAEARVLLLRVTEIEPGNENAWMQLASISEYPEELLGFLDRVLEINPADRRAAEWAKSTKSLLSDAFVERGNAASKNAQDDFAGQCFRQAVAHNDGNETAWLRLAAVSDSAEEKAAHLTKALSLNPENEHALVLLEAANRQKNETLLQQAISAAMSGKREPAKLLLDKILDTAPELVDAWIFKSFLVESFEEKIDCFEKILDIDDENELANLNWTALLDIMAKAESKPPADGAERISAFGQNDFEASKLSLMASETTTNLEYNIVSSDRKLASTPLNFELRTAEKQMSDTDDLPEYTRASPENELSLTEPTTDTEIAVFENSASEPDDNTLSPSEFSGTNTEDYSRYAAELVSIPRDDLPSYYENEANAAEPVEAAENDYSLEFTDEEDGLTENQTSSPEILIPDSEKVGAEVFVAPVLDEDNFFEPSNELTACPFCRAEGEAQSLSCGSCRTMLTLSDLEMLLAYQDADRETLGRAVEQMEEERNWRDFNVEEFKLLAIGQINLKNLRQGCAYLNEAAQLAPNDVVLSSQVNSLKIRLAEIEDQQSIHNSMPKNRKILVVDDSATVRKLISSKLEKSGHEVFCAVDGVDALEKINEIMPDLILLDINMPRMDGYQVCKLIRGNEATKDVPIVMISGKDGFFDKVRGRMAGTTGYITKPFGPETLMKMIDTYTV